MRKTAKIDFASINIYELLESRRQIAHIWGVEDVLEIRPDLTDDQAWEVLQRCDRSLSSESGLDRDEIEYVAADLFPEPEEP